MPVAFRMSTKKKQISRPLCSRIFSSCVLLSNPRKRSAGTLNVPGLCILQPCLERTAELLGCHFVCVYTVRRF